MYSSNVLVCQKPYTSSINCAYTSLHTVKLMQIKILILGLQFPVCSHFSLPKLPFLCGNGGCCKVVAIGPLHTQVCQFQTISVYIRIYMLCVEILEEDSLKSF
jgi:hypothetical protein